MIIDYDKNPALTADQKLQSLIESIQRSINDITDQLIEVRKDIEKLKESE